MIRLIFWGLLILLITSCGQKATLQLPYYQSADFTPVWFEEDDPQLANFHTIPSFALVNQENDTITERTFEDKIYVVDFFFTYCQGICLQMTDNMSIVQEAFKEDEEVLLLSHSVTPKRDSIERLQFYAEEKGVIPGKWHLVTGDKATIYDLGRNAYFIEEDLGLQKGPNDFLHTENFVLIDQHRRIRGIYNGLKTTDIQQLIDDIKLLKRPA